MALQKTDEMKLPPAQEQFSQLIPNAPGHPRESIHITTERRDERLRTAILVRLLLLITAILFIVAVEGGQS